MTEPNLERIEDKVEQAAILIREYCKSHADGDCRGCQFHNFIEHGEQCVFINDLEPEYWRLKGDGI